MTTPTPEYRLNPEKPNEVQVKKGGKWKAFKTYFGKNGAEAAANTLNALKQGTYIFPE